MVNTSSLRILSLWKVSTSQAKCMALMVEFGARQLIFFFYIGLV
jgi:hypothetical protein